tara:strand:- start:674 stop:865 length:192 start_codon:yes stop_codon:yes gene_type:complete
MSKIIKGAANKVQSVNQDNGLTMKETDFLLKLILRSQFDGTEIETCSQVIKKLSAIHRDKLEA